jgi:TolA-binding protein
MNKVILATLSVAISSLYLSAAEPSAFGAGNLDNPSPYGLTSSEKAVLQNKNKLKKVLMRTTNQANEVDSLRERIDGLQSVVESLSRKAQANKISLAEMKNSKDEMAKDKDEYEKRLSEIVEENSNAIKELQKVVYTINESYVTKDEFNSLVKSVNDFKALVAKELKSKSTKTNSGSSLSKMDKALILKKAKEYYGKKYYTKAIEYYSYLARNNYKPAYSYFMLGEMNFKRKKYGDAISFYKKSAALYSKASYMPKLMLNTAISMDRTKDKKNAKAFYNAIISKYPTSAEASSAKKYLKSIK